MKKLLPLALIGVLSATPVFAAGMEGSYQQRSASVADPGLVSAVQSDLSQLGYDVGPIDGIYGPQTRRAVTEYQLERGLPVTGEIDRQTLADLGMGAPQVAEMPPMARQSPALAVPQQRPALQPQPQPQAEPREDPGWRALGEDFNQGIFLPKAR